MSLSIAPLTVPRPGGGAGRPGGDPPGRRRERRVRRVPPAAGRRGGRILLGHGRRGARGGLPGSPRRARRRAGPRRLGPARARPARQRPAPGRGVEGDGAPPRTPARGGARAHARPGGPCPAARAHDPDPRHPAGRSLGGPLPGGGLDVRRRDPRAMPGAPRAPSTGPRSTTSSSIPRPERSSAGRRDASATAFRRHGPRRGCASLDTVVACPARCGEARRDPPVPQGGCRATAEKATRS